MRLVLGASGHALVRLHVVADLEDAFGPGRRQAARFAVDDGGHANARPGRRHCEQSESHTRQKSGANGRHFFLTFDRFRSTFVYNAYAFSPWNV